MKKVFLKYLVIHLVLIMLCTACNETSQIEKSNAVRDSLIPVKEVTPLGKKFFVYDEILHYHTNISDSRVSELLDIENETKDDSLKINVIFDRTPINISDTAFIKKLEKWEFNKKLVEEFKFFAINKIFVEKHAVNQTINKCVTVFRDVLVFKKNKKIVGIAKICFGCGYNWIVGTTAKTENFGYNGDYLRLNLLLGN